MPEFSQEPIQPSHSVSISIHNSSSGPHDPAFPVANAAPPRSVAEELQIEWDRLAQKPDIIADLPTIPFELRQRDIVRIESHQPEMAVRPREHFD